ncbi:unnamed protein product [Blepharisma stoltei]|uniref:G domain-containing protein n=1 Tax=Blepharisma stoltei TaxID=1481888 RepID=A0AAU9IP79_9CILI|nr:unnamed protein product [Blepharisma stoltei]
MNDCDAKVFSEVKSKGSAFRVKLDAANQNSIQKTHILFGATGSGKTTLLHLLNEDQLIVQDGDRGPILKIRDNSIIPGIIGHSVNSETSEPNLYYNQRTRILYIDCPGQEDTHGWGQDLANAFYCLNVFSLCRSKILLYIVSEYEIQSRAVGFRNSLKQLLRLFENHTEELKNNCYLIFTMKIYIQDFSLAIKDINLDPICMEFLTLSLPIIE